MKKKRKEKKLIEYLHVKIKVINDFEFWTWHFQLKKSFLWPNNFVVCFQSPNNIFYHFDIPARSLYIQLKLRRTLRYSFCLSLACLLNSESYRSFQKCRQDHIKLIFTSIAFQPRMLNRVKETFGWEIWMDLPKKRLNMETKSWTKNQNCKFRKVFSKFVATLSKNFWNVNNISI